MKDFQEEYIKNLPDCYRKDKDSNNYKILQLAGHSVEGIKEVLTDIDGSLDLNKATGKTLDLYGDMVGQSRGRANDKQYLMLIKTRIMRNLANGSNKSVVNCLSSILNCDPSEISIKDTPNKPCTVTISNIPLQTVLEADMTTTQLLSLIKTLMPVGIVFETVSFDGTFSFSDSENEQSTTEGFCDVEGGTIGGFFGLLSSDEDNTVLPI